jgi:hypothetical protein
MTLQERVRLLEQAMLMIDDVIAGLPDGGMDDIITNLCKASNDIDNSITEMEQCNE